MYKPATYGVIGAGNGGLAIAAHLAMSGKSVKIFDIAPTVIEEIKRVGGIYVDGKIEGFGKISLATTDIKHVIQDSEIIMVVVPAVAHKIIAKQIAPYMDSEKTIVLTPGATGGSIEFYKTLKESNPAFPFTVAETQSLFYACRSEQLGCSTVYGIKESLGVASLPARETTNVINQLEDVFPQIYAVENVLKTGLENINAIVHPVPTLLNAGLIDKGKRFKYYWDGITPAVGKLLEKLDNERLQIGDALGLSLTSTTDWIKEYYGVSKEKKSMYDVVISNKAYENIYAPDTLANRFLTEDIPMGLVPMMELGKLVGVPVEKMESIITFSETLIGSEVMKNARTLKTLGLDGLTLEEIKETVECNPTILLQTKN